jgi:peptidoglycan/xylan/chitin deacetylase (PgdA/CDA1 family)
MRPSGIPVVMFHGVGRDHPGWPWNHLVTPPELFDAQMRLLKKTGWTTITLDQLHAHMATGATVPDKPVVLTFDDGYRDNRIYAFPILKKYGHRAVIWMSTDFVDPRGDLPPTLDEVWAGKLEESELDPAGYLSWAEMRELVASGHVEIQSHAKTHTWYFSGPRIVDFHRPDGNEGYHAPQWLVWNCFPEKKYASMRGTMAERIPYGTPIYEHEKSLVVRRYFEDQRLTERLIGVVAGDGGPDFFKRPGWRERLLKATSEFGPPSGRIETEDEYRARVKSALLESRLSIERELNRKVSFLCWPGGAYTELTCKIAEEAGYLATTTRYEDRRFKNVFGDDPREINRIGNGSPWVYRRVMYRRTAPGFFLAGLDYFCGKKFSRLRLRLYKLEYLLRYLLFRVK